MIALLAMLCAAGQAFAQPLEQDPGIPTYECHRASGIVVDGKLDEPGWQTAGVAGPFVFPWRDQTGPRQHTVVRLLWDDQRLYVGYDCEDSDIAAVFTRRDEWVFQDDCVEIFLATMPGVCPDYFGFEMNCRGVLYDYFMAFPHLLVSDYTSGGVRLKTRLHGTLNDPSDTDQGWTLELSIPFRSVTPWPPTGCPKVGDVWRFNLNRWDGREPKRCLSQWTPSGQPVPDPHRPQSFGKLVFMGR